MWVRIPPSAPVRIHIGSPNHLPAFEVVVPAVQSRCVGRVSGAPVGLPTVSWTVGTLDFLDPMRRLDDSGRLHVLGRSDVINVDGYKVDPVEVETVIRESLPVREVIVLEGWRGGAPAVRVVVEADPAEITRSMVVEVCRERLSPYKVPANVEIRERIDRDPNSKVLRASLDV